MSNCGLNIGLWYKVSTPSRIKEVKILPSERLVENQDPKYRYFEVLTKDHEGHKSYAMNGTLEECQDFILRNFAVDIPVSEDADNLIRQLEDDVELLRRSENKNYKDISYRIEYMIEYMRHYVSLIRRDTEVKGSNPQDWFCPVKEISLCDLIYMKHFEIWDNCTLTGKWITLVDIDCDKAKIRVTEKEPEVALDFSKGVTRRGYTFGGTWVFDWLDFYNGKYEYEDMFLDIPEGYQLVGSLESFKIRLDDDFWKFGQTFSAD